MLTGKRAVVLGASARGGTGWAIAEALASEGARVVVGARRAEPLTELAAAIGGIAIPCDAADPAQIRAFARAAEDRLGGIDIAVNSAGQTAQGLIETIDPDVVQRSLDMHYIGNVHFIREVTRTMGEGGAITLISSAVSFQPVADRFAYGCAKAAMDCLVRHAAVEFGKRGIRVNSVVPGPIRTELVAPLLERPGVEAAFTREIPLGRIATPEEIAQIVAFLSLPGILSGLNLPASGGMHLMRPPRSEDIAPQGGTPA
jgi:NAD(P)-dependent dehydrogenase (short-subunit alcohol dehydrogenase family)